LPADLDLNNDLLTTEETQLYLGYHATRDIAAGEELLLWYGREWEAAWAGYLEQLQAWLALHGEEGEGEGEGQGESHLLSAPLFRQPLGAPDGLFPDKFFSMACVGTVDCFGYASRRRPSNVAQELNQQNSTRVSLQQVKMARERLLEKPETGDSDGAAFFRQILSNIQAMFGI
jgi:hypothetical protein